MSWSAGITDVRVPGGPGCCDHKNTRMLTLRTQESQAGNTEACFVGWQELTIDPQNARYNFWRHRGLGI